MSNCADMYHAIWEKMQELEPEERTNKRFIVNLRDAIQRSSIKICEEMDEEVQKMELDPKYAGWEQKDIILVYLDQGAAKARRWNEQEGKVVRRERSVARGSSHHRRGRSSDGDRSHVNQALEKEICCEVCGSPTHRHKDCNLKWEIKSTAEKPYLCRFKLASLPYSVFDTTWQQICKNGCHQGTDEASRAKEKTNILEQRAKNLSDRESRKGNPSNNSRYNHGDSDRRNINRGIEIEVSTEEKKTVATVTTETEVSTEEKKTATTVTTEREVQIEEEITEIGIGVTIEEGTVKWGV